MVYQDTNELSTKTNISTLTRRVILLLNKLAARFISKRMERFLQNIHRLSDAMKGPLPGEDAQYRMAPVSRLSRKQYLEMYEEHRISSVMILLYPDERGTTHTMLIRRQGGSHVHGGQIALPGGKEEQEDISLWHTASRETEEEIGVEGHLIQQAGALTPLFIPVSRFLVHPYVGFTPFTPQFTANEEEVSMLIPANLNELVQMPVEEKQVITSYGTIRAPYYEFDEHHIWGATAMILSEFLTVWKKGQR
jgi:8-oxo-dGTP pyrophosphatase MutT (NUDIX family)